MSAQARARKAIKDKKLTAESAKDIVAYCRDLMIRKSAGYKRPPDNLYPVAPKTWIEEVMAMGYILAGELSGSQAEKFLAGGQATQFVAILFFAAAYVGQLDVISPVIDMVVQNLVCVDILIPYFIHTRNHLAVSLLLDCYASEMRLSTKLCACLFLVKFPAFAHKVVKFLDELEERYPIHVIAIRMNLIVEGQPPAIVMDHAEELREMMQRGLELAPKDPMMLYNAAYIEAMMRNRDKAYELLSQSFALKPYDHRTFLFLLKMLRSYEHPRQLLNVWQKQKFCFSGKHKGIMFEALWAMIESNDRRDAIKLGRKMTALWPNDSEVMSVIMRAVLSSKLEEFKPYFEKWTEFDTRTPELYFCFAQLCSLWNEHREAQKWLHTAIELDPCNAEYHASLACAMAKTGEREKAQRQAKIALQFNPYLALCWLALSCSTEGEESEEAKKKYMELRNDVDVSKLEICLFVQGNSN